MDAWLVGQPSHGPVPDLTMRRTPIRIERILRIDRTHLDGPLGQGALA